MDDYAKEKSGGRTIREIKDDLLWEAAQAGREAVVSRLQEKEHVTPAEKKAASRALNAMSRMFW